MSSFLRQHATVVITTSAGIALSATAAFILHKLGTRIHGEISLLVQKVEQLRKEVADLRQQILEQNSKAQFSVRARSSYGSLTGAASDDDDDTMFEEAIESNFYGSLSSLTSTDEFQSAVSGPTTPLSTMLPQIDKLLNGSTAEQEQAYSILSNYTQGQSHDPEFLWRFAKATFTLRLSHGDEEKKEMCYRANELASEALQLTDQISNVHKWYAITLGALGDYEPMKVKIQNGFAFKEHIDKAMEMDPTDATNYHLRGRWCYSVYMLSWVERNAAAALFASPPTSTADESLHFFQKAEELNPEEWKENKLYIAKCYIAKGDYYAAVVWLDAAAVIPAHSPDDDEAEAELTKLLYSYSGYRR